MLFLRENVERYLHPHPSRTFDILDSISFSLASIPSREIFLVLTPNWSWSEVWSSESLDASGARWVLSQDAMVSFKSLLPHVYGSLLCLVMKEAKSLSKNGGWIGGMIVQVILIFLMTVRRTYSPPRSESEVGEILSVAVSSLFLSTFLSIEQFLVLFLRMANHWDRNVCVESHQLRPFPRRILNSAWSAWFYFVGYPGYLSEHSFM